MSNEELWLRHDSAAYERRNEELRRQGQSRWRHRYVGALYCNLDGTIKGILKDIEGRQYRVRLEYDDERQQELFLHFETVDLVEKFWRQGRMTFMGAIRWPEEITEPITLVARENRTSLKSGKRIAFEVRTRRHF